jgi:DNA-binding GntR family transcriptional regulator
MQSRFASFVLGALSIAIVLTAIAILDEEVRVQLTAVLAGDLSQVTRLASAQYHEAMQAFHGLAFTASGYKPLSAFAVGASVLVVFLRKL